MKCRYPDVFAAALLNAQPMGFYAPAQIVRDAQEHGVEVRPVDVNHSDWDATLEPGQRGPCHPRHRDQEGDTLCQSAVRLGLRAVKGLGEAPGRAIAAARGAGYDSVRDLWLRSGVSPADLEKLAAGDAFRSLGLDRRAALWAVKALCRAGDKDNLPLFASAHLPASEPDAFLPAMPLGAHVVEDYRHLSLSLKAHPVLFVRDRLATRGAVTAGSLGNMRPGQPVTVAGLVLVRQRPGSAKGVIFMTLEDETGASNIIVWPKVFETYRPVVLGARFVAVSGRLQSEGGVIHVVAHRLIDLTADLGTLLHPTDPGAGRIGQAALAPADHVVSPLPSRTEGRASPAKRAKIAALLAEEPGLAGDLAKDFDPLSRADEVRRPQRDHRDRRVAREPQTLMAPVTAVAVRQVLPKGRNFQ
jgi:error-prone DNA polymerase